MRALHTAATGMMAQELNVQVISNNIANMRTTGYKRQRAEFQDLLYEHVRRVGTQTSTRATSCRSASSSARGVKTVGTPRVMSQGTISPTGRSSTSRSAAKASSRSQLPDGRTAYTRDGSFEMRRAGPHRHRAGLRDRSPASPSRRTRQAITISPQGQVSAHAARPDHADPARPDRAGALRQQGRPAGDRRQPVRRNAGLAARRRTACRTPTAIGDLQQGNLEQANVEAVTEISDLIAAQRAYEMNAKVITAADQMLSATSNLMR